MPAPMEQWRTAIAHSGEPGIWIRGSDVTALMPRPFTDTIFLLHRGRLPNPGERQLLDAVLVGVADHGAGAPSCAPAPTAPAPPPAPPRGSPHPATVSRCRPRLRPGYSPSATITAAPARGAW